MYKILIIDDYKEIRDLYKKALQNKGYKVEVVEDAEKGVQKILEGGYDLILLDLLMPVKDGIWVLDKIRGKKTKKPNKKIVVMGIADKEGNYKLLVREAKDRGASDYLDKRISIENELILKIKNYLEN